MRQAEPRDEAKGATVDDTAQKALRKAPAVTLGWIIETANGRRYVRRLPSRGHVGALRRRDGREQRRHRGRTLRMSGAR
jgi:hypothetical protein